MSAQLAGYDIKASGVTLDRFCGGGITSVNLAAAQVMSGMEDCVIAGGTEILQGTDIRVAGESAKFGVSEAKWSLYPMGGSAVRLPRQIPYTVAADLLLTGRHITAAEAKEYGLIGHVVPDGGALDKALELAELINANGPLAVQAMLRTMRATEGMHEEEAFKVDAK